MRSNLITTVAFLTMTLVGSLTAQLPPVIDLGVTPGTESSEVTRVYGMGPYNNFGGNDSNGIAFGDINGDGFDDVLIGAPRTNNTASETTGAVNVIYGNPALPASAEIDLNSAFGTYGETRIFGRSHDLAGGAVASGDLNGDGFDDVLIGCKGSHPVRDVVVFYGNASFPSSTEITFSYPYGQLGETRVSGASGFNYMGHSITSGDVNGDGFDDMILGAPGAGPPVWAGGVVIVYGNSSLPTIAEIDLNSTPGAHGETRILGVDESDFTGGAATTGDVNGDGFDDVIFSAPQAAPGSPERDSAGEVFILYGSSSLSASSEIDLDSVPGFHGETRILGDEAGSRVGNSISSGDVNCDGFDDVIIGAVGGYGCAAAIVYGSRSLPASGEIDLVTPAGAHGETRIYTDDTSSRMGHSVACGDVNGDGNDDVIIGAITASLPGRYHMGQTVIIYGSPSLSSNPMIDFNVVSPDVRVVGDNEDDHFGYGGESGGDLNRDGIVDFAASAYWADNPSLGGDNNSGVAYLLYGDGTMMDAIVTQFTRLGDGLGGDVVPPTDFGPVVRCEIDYSDDDTADNGHGGASLTTVVLTRSTAGINGLNPISLVANSVWEVTTDRVGWASADMTFQYTDAEVAGLIESDLVVFQAPSLTGPWTRLVTTLDTFRNEATVTVNEFSHFALADGLGTVPIELSVLCTE